MPQPISSSLMSRYMLSDENSQCFQPSKKMKKCVVDLKKSGCSEQSREAEATRDFRYDCENFAGIAKILQS